MQSEASAIQLHALHLLHIAAEKQLVCSGLDSRKGKWLLFAYSLVFYH